MNKPNPAPIQPRLLDSEPARKILESRFGADHTNTILEEAAHEYTTFASDLPYLGDDPHMNSLPMVEAAYFLALCRTLRTRLLTTEAIGKIYYEMFEAFLNVYPKWQRWLYGRLRYNRDYIERYRAYAAETQQRRYPEDFVCHFVEGDGRTFDYGYDYTECAILKYFQRYEADEFAPYFCHIDFLLAKTFHRGLTRPTALSEGDERCEFRYKKGRPTQAGWPPAFLEKQ